MSYHSNDSRAKIAEVAVALELRILDEMQGFRLEKLLEPGEVVFAKERAA